MKEAKKRKEKQSNHQSQGTSNKRVQHTWEKRNGGHGYDGYSGTQTQ